MYQRHREKHLAYQSARRQENIEESRAIARQWRRDHPELAKQKDREQYARNASKNAQRKREKRAANPELTRDSSNEWRRRTGKGATYSQNRRAVLIAAWVEDVDILAVFNRDGYVCQICGIDCPPDLKWPERNAPTLDHIIPLAWGVFRGGFHSYANCQTACFECNARKGARE
jgi:5-methylcytosine-specific restriction endonuclease McrA